jgi:hypothetical protein
MRSSGARVATTAAYIAATSCLICLASPGCVAHNASSANANLRGPAFASPEKAVDALVGAVRSGSPDRISKVLGPDADELVRSGDSVQDCNRTKHFVTLYDERHEILPTVIADDTPATAPAATNPSETELTSQTLCIGASHWPFPIPLVKDGDKWRFDTAAGRGEILNRRVGRNELNAIETLRAIVDAERDYVSRRVSQPGGLPEYAGKFVSEARKNDGLYWPAVQGQEASPLEEFVSAAASEGYEIGAGQPYHGYYYRFLKSQGTNASGGAYDYDVNGKLIGGFAVIARPATYGNSGVMSFVVNQDGTVYQADLGTQTETAADQIQRFDPDSRWHKVDDEDRSSSANSPDTTQPIR